MRPRAHHPTHIPVALAALALCGTFALRAPAADEPARSEAPAPVSVTTNSAPSQPVIPKSVFADPASSGEGKDPFFPDLRDQISAVPKKAGVKASPADLTLQGISGPAEHRLAIINGHSFAAGEEGDVLVPGGRIHIRCVEIKTNSVTIEIGGLSRELRFRE
jgi:hypothetical protein